MKREDILTDDLGVVLNNLKTLIKSIEEQALYSLMPPSYYKVKYALYKDNYKDRFILNLADMLDYIAGKKDICKLIDFECESL